MKAIKIFLASSSELANDRKEFQVFISQLNRDWFARGYIFLINIWENALDALSKDGLQSEYNQAIEESDIFVLLFFTKVGQYSKEEFDVANKAFLKTKKPLIYTYFKEDLVLTSSINRSIVSLLDFKDELSGLGHYYTRYKNTEDLKWQFARQLDKLYSENSLSSLEINDNSSQSDIDTIALTMSNKLLTDGNWKVDKIKLDTAIGRSSDFTKHMIYLIASRVRGENWANNRKIMARTIPIFESLIKNDLRKDKHYYYGQLGYALKDKPIPDWANAKKNLDEALEIYGDEQTRDETLHYYDFNRAICIINLDKNFIEEKASTKAKQKVILKDLKTFKSNYRGVFSQFLDSPFNISVTKWMRLNNISSI